LIYIGIMRFVNMFEYTYKYKIRESSSFNLGLKDSLILNLKGKRA